MKKCVFVFSVILLFLSTEFAYPQSKLNLGKHRLNRSKASLLKKYGGSKKTEQAVTAALEWFNSIQEDDGRWSAESVQKKCGDPLPLVGNEDHWKFGGISVDVPLTGLVLLAFQGAGPDVLKKYQKEYTKGMTWLMSAQKGDGSWGGTNYTNAICTLAMIEAFAMTNNPKIRENAVKAIEFLEKQQCEEGGWDYGGPSVRSDTSVTAWTVYALSTAEHIGLASYRRMPVKRGAPGKGPLFFSGPLKSVYSFLERVIPPVEKEEIEEHAKYIYTTKADDGERDKRSENMTVASAYCLLRTGQIKDDPRYPALLNKFISRDYPNREWLGWYGWHWATQVFFQAGGEYWKEWNKHISYLLPAIQETEGVKKGSWSPRRGDWSSEWAGRIFTTAVGCMCLEVYYRYPMMYEDEKQVTAKGFPGPRIWKIDTEEEPEDNEEAPAEEELNNDRPPVEAEPEKEQPKQEHEEIEVF